MLRECQRLRYHGNGEVIRREEFAQRKQAAEELQLARLNTKAKRLASAGKKFDGYPVLQVLCWWTSCSPVAEIARLRMSQQSGVRHRSPPPPSGLHAFKLVVWLACLFTLH